MKKLLLLGCLMLVAFVSQAKTITGKVVDETNTPLLGVAILNNNNKQSTMTDFDGLYSIEAKRNDILSFHTENYHLIIMKVKKSKLNISLKPLGQQNFIRCYSIIPSISSQTISNDTILGDKKSITEKLKTQIPNGNIIITDTTVTEIQDIPFEERLYLINGKPTKLKDSGIIDSEELKRIKTVKEDIEPLFIINGKVSSVQQFRAIDPKKVESVTVLRLASDLILYCRKNTDGIIVIETSE